jgi:hypothetical protein
MTGKEGVSRRSILGASVDRALNQEDTVYSRVLDIIAPESIPQVRKLRDLQDLPGELPQNLITNALGDVMRLFPIEYDLVRGGPEWNYSHASHTLALGPVDIKISHLNWYGIYSGEKEVTVAFNPDTNSIDEVEFRFSISSDDTGRSNSGTFNVFKPLKMTNDEEDAYIDEMDEQGFYDFDPRVILESIYQSIVFGERSEYWERAKDMLRIQDLAAFNKSWFDELLKNRGIDPKFYEFATRKLPIRESIHLIKGGERLRRIDALRLATRKVTAVARDIFNPREKAVLPRGD